MEVFSALASTVVFLFALGGQIPIGTGFIIGYPVPNQENSFVPLLVTAKHVIAGHSAIVARFSSQEGIQPVQVRLDLDASRKSGDLWEHPDNGVDIVLVRTLHFSETKYLSVPIKMISTKQLFNEEDIKTTDRVIFPSLLVNFMGLKRNYPVMRDGSIALIPDEDVPLKYQVGSGLINTKQTVILLNATSVPGASGSPVFLHPGPRMKNGALISGGAIHLLGIMHGFYPALPRAIEELEVTAPKPFFKENSGIAIMFPAWRIREILETPAFTDHMNEVLSEPIGNR